MSCPSRDCYRKNPQAPKAGHWRRQRELIPNICNRDVTLLSSSFGRLSIPLGYRISGVVLLGVSRIDAAKRSRKPVGFRDAKPWDLDEACQ